MSRRLAFSLFVLSLAIGAACRDARAPLTTGPSALAVTDGSVSSSLAFPDWGSGAEGSAPVSFAACLRGVGPSACTTSPHPKIAAAAEPPAPSGLTAAVSGAAVQLSWQAPTSPDPIVTYVIEAGSSPGAANLASLPTGSLATSFATAGVPNGTYYVRVRAATATALGAPSNEVVVVVGGTCGVPGAPTGLAVVSNSANRVSFAWQPAAGAPTAYVVSAGSAPGASNLAVSNVGLATTLTASNVAAGTYYVRVAALNGCGTSGPSNEVVVTVGGGGGNPGPTVSVAGFWTLTVPTGPFRPYSTYTVTLTQAGNTLGGTILPVGTSRSTRVLGTISGRNAYFGSESAWWNDVINGRPDVGVDIYFTMTVDDSGTRMTGSCPSCAGAVTAVRIR